MRDERLFPLFEPLTALPGIGPKLAPALERLIDGPTVWDLLLHLPERWVDRRVRESFEQAEPGEVGTVRGSVHSHKAAHSATAPHRIRLVDDSGFLTLVFFRANPQWLQRQFPMNAERVVSGRIEDFNGERQIVHPDHICDPEKDALPPAVEPIYRLTAGLTNKRVHTAAIAALSHVPEDLPEWVDPPLLAREGWMAFRSALTGLHNPEAYDEDAFALAARRLAYDEALARELYHARARAARKLRPAPSLPPAPDAQNALAATLPYKLTGAQIRAVKEIGADLADPFPMRRMLQGDVGAGKTLVGALAAVQAAHAGYQTAFMAPTEVLARQQYDTIHNLLSPLSYRVAALTGRDKGKSRQQITEGLASGEIQVVAGTQALIQQDVDFHQLGLIIVDEQHRFGVMDRARLADKGLAPHILVMSATPIPRTLAQAVNGDLDTSVLDEKPVGRQPVQTSVLPDTRIEEVTDAVRRACVRGEQVFWVCPRVDAEDDSSAIARHAALRDQVGDIVGLVHGRLKPAEKDAALEDFRSGRTKVLVATTVIEVGVDVPNATIMVIERAEGFGLAQLHQLRGRVGRGSKKSYCLLVYRPPLGETAQKRLSTLRETEDGFEIAEVDYQLRGPGDVLGLRQSGAPVFRILSLSEHADLFEIAKSEAAWVMERGDQIDESRADGLGLLKTLLAPRPAKDPD